MTDVRDSIETTPWKTVRSNDEALLLEQLDYVMTESDFYRRRFNEQSIRIDDITSVDDFELLPFTTKQDERDCQRDPSASQPLGTHQAAPTDKLNRTISSSGTTGKPTYFGLTRNDREHWNVVLQRCFHTAGVRSEDTVMFGAGQTMVPGGVPYFEGLTKLGANIVPAGGESTERLLQTTSDLHGDVMWTTTSHLRYLTGQFEEVLECSPTESSISKLIGGGGPGIATPAIRQELYEKWDADLVREIMGLGDVVGCMWAECEAEDGMHFHGQGHVFVELINPRSGDVVPFKGGAEGELVYTPLQREATPLLRFRSGDYIRVTGMSCKCGRTSPKIQCIGRSDDMLIYKGMNVFPSAIRDIVSEVNGATPQIRVVLPEEDQVNFETPIPLQVARDPNSQKGDEKVEDEIISRVRNKLKVRVDPVLMTISDLPHSEYKTDLVVTDERS